MVLVVEVVLDVGRGNLAVVHTYCLRCNELHHLLDQQASQPLCEHRDHHASCGGNFNSDFLGGSARKHSMVKGMECLIYSR